MLQSELCQFIFIKHLKRKSVTEVEFQRHPIWDWEVRSLYILLHKL